MYGDRLNYEEIITLLDVLLGNTEPIADSAVDRKIMHNVTMTIEIANYIMEKLNQAAKYTHSPYASQNLVAKEALRELIVMRDWITKLEEEYS